VLINIHLIWLISIRLIKHNWWINIPIQTKHRECRLLQTTIVNERFSSFKLNNKRWFNIKELTGLKMFSLLDMFTLGISFSFILNSSWFYFVLSLFPWTNQHFNVLFLFFAHYMSIYFIVVWKQCNTAIETHIFSHPLD
jgi:hypothetical protein